MSVSKSPSESGDIVIDNPHLPEKFQLTEEMRSNPLIMFFLENFQPVDIDYFFYANSQNEISKHGCIEEYKIDGFSGLGMQVVNFSYIFNFGTEKYPSSLDNGERVDTFREVSRAVKMTPPQVYIYPIFDSLLSGYSGWSLAEISDMGRENMIDGEIKLKNGGDFEQYDFYYLPHAKGEQCLLVDPLVFIPEEKREEYILLRDSIFDYDRVENELECKKNKISELLKEKNALENTLARYKKKLQEVQS